MLLEKMVAAFLKLFQTNKEVTAFDWTACSFIRADIHNELRCDGQMEVERIEAAIAELKQLQNGEGDGSGVMANHGSRKSSRGRKSMGSDEREEVSLRMKRYWASRRENPHPPD